MDGLSKNAYERRITRLEDERREMMRKLADSNRALQKFAHGGPISPTSQAAAAVAADNDHATAAANDSGAEIRKLRDEVNRLTKRNSELEVSVSDFEQQSKEMTSLKRDLEFAESEKLNKMKELDKQMKSMRLEKEDLNRDLTEAQEKLKLQSKELKDAVAQRKLAMSEYTEVTDKLSELRQQKQKLSRQVRDKEEELETSLQKTDTLRQDIRKAEKLRRELELRAEDALNEAAKEKKLREKNEASTKQLEKEVAALKAGGLGAGGVVNDTEVITLRAELERLEVVSQEALLNQQSKHNADLASLREQFDEGERRVRTYEMDVQALREKLDKTRMDSLQVRGETIQIIFTECPYRNLLDIQAETTYCRLNKSFIKKIYKNYRCFRSLRRR